MNLHRSNGGQKIRPSTLFLRLLLIAAIAGESFGQASHSRRVSREPSAKEISGDLVSREGEPSYIKADVKAEDPSTLSEAAIIEKIMIANARRSAELRAFEGKRWYHLE